MNQIKLIIEIDGTPEDKELFNKIKVADVKMSATEEDIYKMFEFDPVDYRLIIYFEELIKFRKKVADIFSLADKDNDKTLHHILDELEEFWQILQDEIDRLDE